MIVKTFSQPALHAYLLDVTLALDSRSLFFQTTSFKVALARSLKSPPKSFFRPQPISTSFWAQKNETNFQITIKFQEKMKQQYENVLWQRTTCKYTGRHPWFGQQIIIFSNNIVQSRACQELKITLKIALWNIAE